MQHVMKAIALLAACTLAQAEPAGWVTFHGNFGRTGSSPVDFPTCAFGEAWTFDLGAHTWRYHKGTSVWSASPVVAPVKGRWMVIVGAYDNNLYGIDAETGEEIWRFTTGGPVAAAPTFAEVSGRPLVFAGSADRTLYAVDAETGA